MNVNEFENNTVKLLNKSEFLALTKLSNTTAHRLDKERQLPRPIHLGGRCKYFIESEVLEVIAARAAGYTNEEVKEIILKQEQARKKNANRMLQSLNRMEA